MLIILKEKKIKIKYQTIEPKTFNFLWIIRMAHIIK